MQGILGQRIRELRIRKGITQEKLGQMVGMTAQGVSKWERGASPDAELLPKIADVLGVTIDALFGCEREESLEQTVTNELSSMESDEAFRRAFGLCWSIEMGLTGKNSIKDRFGHEMLDSLEDEYGNEFYSRLMFDSGIVTARLSKDMRYFFLMPESEKGAGNYLGKTEELAGIFRILSMKENLRILEYLYRRNNTHVSLKLIADKTGTDEKAALECMNELCSIGLAVCYEVETDRGIIKTYSYEKGHVMLPLLIIARELRSEKQLNVVTLCYRKKPLI